MGKRVILIILDSAGVGAMPDAGKYGDKGANTFKNTADAVGGLSLPNLRKLGMGNIVDIKGVNPVSDPQAMYGKMAEASNSKDTMAGHWEMMGLITEIPFPLYPDGFPDEIINSFMKVTGVRGILGNRAESGTKIIKELGEEHIKTSFPIVYTSGDSVFQIAAHEDVIPLKTLYDLCESARDICDKYNIGRVIARPFTGEEGNFKRTADRKDYPMVPPGKTVLDILEENNVPVTGIGKIEDIFARRGVPRAIHTKNNSEGMKVLSDELLRAEKGLIFINLVDFDMLYGHRRDPNGYAGALEEFDRGLGEFINKLRKDDIVMITADHGCDPTFKGTDHTREYVPLLVFGEKILPGNMGIRKTFSDIGISILNYFEIGAGNFPGNSFI
ncbi:MAG: phosphopentomutase [Acidobacteriota bacterium]